MSKSVLITQCLQNDFVKPIRRHDPLPNLLHVGHDESQRLMGVNPEEGPISQLMQWAGLLPKESLEIVHIRDLHQSGDPAQVDHLRQFGDHCLRDTPGAEFVFPLTDGPRNHIVDSRGLNDFLDTNLEAILAPFKQEKTKIGLVGVWTEAKITFLAYEIRTRFPEFQIGVCSALTASSSRAHHFMALDQLKRLLGVEIFPSVGEFTTFLVGKKVQIPLPIPENSSLPELEIDGLKTIQESDRKLIRYLFRDCRKVHLKVLDGGFSGNLVLGTESVDLFGHRQVPFVVKIGEEGPIGKERTAFEKIEGVLGNNAPSIMGFADFEGRGALKYRYAGMGGGFSTTFQKRYCQDLSIEKIRKFLSEVFVEQLGRFYAASTLEKINLLEYYGFQPKFSASVRKNVEKILQGPANEEVITIAQGVNCPNLCYFYEKELSELMPRADRFAFISFVHGDLNGANIIIDAHENVWLIDFFHTHRGHILKDLIKLENDLLYIFTPIRNEKTLIEACRLTDLLLEVEDLGGSLSHTPPWLKYSDLRRAYETVKILRSFYPNLLRSARDPLQLLVGQLRYAAHNLSFDESDDWQKKWALYASSCYAEKIAAILKKNGPLRVDWIPQTFTTPGKIGLTFLPGRKDYGRDVKSDVKTLKNLGVTHIVTLISAHEFEKYGVPDLFEEYKKVDFFVRHLPILDQGVPSLAEMRELIHWIDEQAKNGASIVIHCVGGLGRSGTVVACYLKAHGKSTAESLLEVRKTRPRAIETPVQEEFIEGFGIQLNEG